MLHPSLALCPRHPKPHCWQQLSQGVLALPPHPVLTSSACSGGPRQGLTGWDITVGRRVWTLKVCWGVALEDACGDQATAEGAFLCAPSPNLQERKHTVVWLVLSLCPVKLMARNYNNPIPVVLGPPHTSFCTWVSCLGAQAPLCSRTPLRDGDPPPNPEHLWGGGSGEESKVQRQLSPTGYTSASPLPDEPSQAPDLE